MKNKHEQHMLIQVGLASI